MNRRIHFLLPLCLLALPASIHAAERKPNILVIVGGKAAAEQEEPVTP